MRKLTLFYIFFAFSLPLTGCYVDRKQLEDSTLQVEDQQQSKQNRIIPSYTTIYEAIKDRALDKTIALLQGALKSDKEVDLIQVDSKGRSLLHLAIVDADLSQEILYLEIVNLLIKLDQDVNARDNEANTPLHIAASKGLFFVAESLIGNGADIYAENEYSIIPLHYAVEGGNIEVVRLLIDQNKTVERTMRSLILRRSDSYIDKQDNHGRTPLYLAMYKLSLYVGDPVFGNLDKYILIVKLLIASGADVHTENKYGTTLLHIAAEGGCIEMVRILLEEKVKVNLCDKNTNSPLALAIRGSGTSPRVKDYLMVMNMLIEAGANVHHANEYNSTLLHIAAIYGNLEVVKLLIDHKVEINFKDNAGYTPLHLAADHSANSNVEILEQKCYLEVVDLLIQRGAMIDVENYEGYTPLQLAIRGGSDKVAIYLIKQRANIKPINSHSLLHDAIDAIDAIDSFCPGTKDAYIALIKYLISLGVDTNDVDGQGDTPLHLATKKLWMPGFQEVVNLLIAAGSDIYAVNNRGNTPLFYMKKYIRRVLL